MDNIVITDDDRQTSSNDESSSDDISSVAIENVLPVYENDQRQISSMNSIDVSPMKVNNCSSLSNIKIKHPYQSDENENDPFNDESSSDDISSVAIENVLPVYENDQRQTPSMSSIDVSPVKVNNCSSLSNIKIKHPYQSDPNENDPFNDESSSDDISSVAIENLLPVYENDQRQIPSMSSIDVSPVKVNNCNSLSNIKIKHPYQSDENENDPFNDEKRIIIDEHVKVSHINRSSLRRINKDTLLLRLDSCSSQRNTSNVTVYRTNNRNSQSMNGNLNNRQITQMTSRQSTVKVSRISTAANIKQGSKQKVIVSKPMITRGSTSNERSLQMKQKELHASVKHASVDSKKSS
jgi:hypothetical protein